MNKSHHRTCRMRHYCERDLFHKRNIRGKDSPGYQYRFEVWDSSIEQDMEWGNYPPQVEKVFETDDRAEAEAFVNQGAQRCEIVENGICEVCDLYDQRKRDMGEGKVRPFYLISYGVSRYCYSRAEGGCWADWTSIHEVRRAFTLKAGLQQAKELKEKYPQPRYNRFSCANRGETDNYIVVCYSEDDPRWPQESTRRETYQ